MTHRRTAPLGLALLLMACSSPTAPETSLWEGDLAPVVPSTVSGVVAAVSQFGRTVTSIELRQGQAGSTYTWRIDSGTCAEPGQIQGGNALYPQMVAGEAGTASADASLPGHFVTSVQYAARIIDESDVVVACGPLRRAE